jgi:hypothetical protein
VIAVKMAILYAGHSFQHQFLNMDKYKSWFAGVIYLPDLAETDLSTFDILVVPDRSHQELIYENRQKLVDFLQAGKWLIALGEMFRPWLPEAGWEYCPTNFSWWVKEGGELPLFAPDPDHRLFQHITIDDARWHYHGMFWPPEGSRVILENDRGAAIIYEDDATYAGKLIATTLDPIYHIGADFIPQAEIFLDGLLQWVKAEYDRS